MNDKKKIKEAIKVFQDKIKKQGLYTNVRDELHLSGLKQLLKQIEQKENNNN